MIASIARSRGISEHDFSRILVDVREHEVKLSGTVPTYAQRRIAENEAWAVSGVDDVVDMMHVDH